LHPTICLLTHNVTDSTQQYSMCFLGYLHRFGVKYSLCSDSSL